MTTDNGKQIEDIAVVDLSAEVDPAAIRLLSPEASATTASLTYPDFTYRHVWGDQVGWRRLNLTTSLIKARSNVFVSVSELDPIVSSQDPVPKPFVGAAPFTVHNVAPYNGGVVALVYINWQEPLFTQLSYLVINP